MTALLASTAEDRIGRQARARPASSITIASSTNVDPAPPYISGTAMPRKPRSSPNWRQVPRSTPVSDCMASRTAGSAERCSKNRRAVELSSACSGVSRKLTTSGLLWAGAVELVAKLGLGDHQDVESLDPVAAAPERVHFQRGQAGSELGRDRRQPADDVGDPPGVHRTNPTVPP